MLYIRSLKRELREINANVKAILLNGLVKHLAPHVEAKQASSSASPAVANDSPAGGITVVQSSPVVKVNTSMPYSKELLSSGDITQIFTKSRNRHNFAALLVKRLFDVPTRIRSNVSGRGKEKLDPKIMQCQGKSIFEFYEWKDSEVKKEWASSVIAIDEKSRSLKR